MSHPDANHISGGLFQIDEEAAGAHQARSNYSQGASPWEAFLVKPLVILVLFGFVLVSATFIDLLIYHMIYDLVPYRPLSVILCVLAMWFPSIHHLYFFIGVVATSFGYECFEPIALYIARVSVYPYPSKDCVACRIAKRRGVPTASVCLKHKSESDKSG